MQSPIGEPSGREYGGIHIGGDFVFDFGGGHGAYPGNDVELYTISKNRWDQMYTPETPPITPGAGPYLAICQIGGGWAGPTPNGRPYVEHTYQYFAWDPVNGVFFGLTTSGTWIYDPAKNLWTHLGGGPRGFSFGGPGRWGVFYDPPTGKFHLMITAGDSEGLWTWDGTRWARKPTKWPTSKWSVMYEAYIADRGYHFIICWERFWKYDALASTWTELRDVPWFDSMDYDVVNRRLIVVNHGQTPIIVYVWNPMGDTWTVLPNVTDTPRVKYGRSAMGPLLRYDKDRNVFLFLQQGTAAGGNSNTADTAMWAYRYMK